MSRKSCTEKEIEDLLDSDRDVSDQEASENAILYQKCGDMPEVEVSGALLSGNAAGVSHSPVAIYSRSSQLISDTTSDAMLYDKSTLFIY